MNKYLVRMICMLLVTLCFIVPASATLIGRGNGFIYNKELDITWLWDANYAQTSGFDSDGKMNWGTSVAFADNLVHMGYSDWRLPKSLQPDPGCSGQKTNESFGYGCIGSEMGRLFYDLGGTAGSSVLLSGNPSLGLFANLQSNSYWTETQTIGGSNVAWNFDFNDGAQHNNGFDFEFYSLVVRDGDVIPEPSTLVLMGLGLGGLLVYIWLKRRFRIFKFSRV